MFRYLTFIWDPLDPAQSEVLSSLVRHLLAQPAPLRLAIDEPGLRTFCTGPRTSGDAYLLPNGGGVIVGTLFQRVSNVLDDSPSLPATLGECQSAAIVRSEGRHLIDAYWGWYVAFLQYRSSHTKWVVRGPMGDLPCFHVTYKGVHIFCSWIDDCVSLGALPFTIDWDFVAAQVVFGAAIRIGESALEQVKPLERGECISIRGRSVSKHVYWHPGLIAQSTAFDEPAHAARALRATARSCVFSWASRHESILVRLSGGFDSSVVANVLRDVPTRPRVTCYNFFVPGPLGDERRFARLAAQRAGFDLLEREWGHDGDLSIVGRVARTAAPILDFSDWQEHPWEHGLAAATGATATFTGSLGDVLFEMNPGASPAADFVHRHGVRPGLIGVVLDVARRQRISVWRVLRSGIEDLWLSRTLTAWNPFSMTERDGKLGPGAILTCDAVTERLNDTLGRFVHAWLRDVEGVPPGKLWMITALCVEGFYEAHFKGPHDPILLAPYMSQPLTELCLRIPTHLNVKGGWDRAVARMAFAQDLPREIARRTTKGSPGAWLRHVVNRNERFIRSFLLDGVLTAERILDPRRLEEALPGAMSKTVCDGGTIMNLLYTEAWLRAWKGTTHRGSAAA